MKNIILINSSTRPSQVLIDLFNNLDNDKFSLSIFSTNKTFLRQFSHKSENNKLISFGSRIKTGKGMIAFFLLFPFILLKQLFNTYYYKKKYGVDVLVCVELREKIIFTIIAKYLKIKIIWIEKPIVKNLKKNSYYLKVLRFLANKNKVKIISFLEIDKKKLVEYGFLDKNIINISLGIKGDFSQHQDSIFSSIANLVSSKGYHNRFSIGVFLDDKKIHDSEIIFKAVKICIDRFHNFRLVIIGNEKVRKRAMWLAKQSGIGELSCFIGDASGVSKIQQSVDVFLALDVHLKLIDLFRVLSAMMFKIPIISMKNGAMSELLVDKKTGLLISRDSVKELADAIIKLQKDEMYRNTISGNAYSYASKNFSFEKQMLKFEEILLGL